MTTPQIVHIDDVDIAYKEIGSGEPLLMIRGYGGSMELWNDQLIQPLSHSSRIILFDNRGMGHSQSSDKEYSIPLFASDAVGLLDALKIQKANVLGYSMGSFVAQEIALIHPYRVKKLILIAASVGGKEGIPPGPEGLAAITNTSGTPEERMNRFIRATLPPGWLQQHPDISSYVPIQSIYPPADRLQRQLQAIVKWQGTFSRLEKTTHPTLIITGMSDIIVQPENAMLLAQRIPDSWLVRIPSGGHGIVYQYPELIADQVSLFLREAES